tara:strand:- start:13308 stop:15434 length:2127 start_codon:yes stop_codon:yes gene_type:complete
MAKQIAFSQEAQEAMQRGISKLAEAVRVTLGPKGRDVIIEKNFGSPTVTKDGVSVAREIGLPDMFEDMGARMVREVASKTSDIAGDGTTTATILAQEIYSEGLKSIVAGVSPSAIRRGMDKAVDDIVEKLREMSIECTTQKAISQVGKVASNGDEEIGKILAYAMDQVGKDGVITVEEGQSRQTSFDVVEGMQFDRGYLSPYFVTDPQCMSCDLENVYVLVHEKKISNIKDLVPVLEKVVNAGKPLLIIAEDIEGEALSALVVNKLRGTIYCCAVKAPGYGDRRKTMLQDIAIMVGGQVIFEDLGTQLENLQLSDLGTAKKVSVDKDNTIIIEGGGKDGDIKNRIEQIRRELENSTSDYDIEKLEERIAKLSGGVAQINVGATTESEMKEKKTLVENALSTVRAAVAEGILPGGGVALLRCSRDCKPNGLSQEEKVGYNIIRQACRSPLIQIANNAEVDGFLVCENVLKMQGNKGYNALTDTYEDLIQAGIIDPVKVTRTALQNAASVAGLLLSVENSVTKTGGLSSTEKGGMEGIQVPTKHMEEKKSHSLVEHKSMHPVVWIHEQDSSSALHLNQKYRLLIKMSDFYRNSLVNDSSIEISSKDIPLEGLKSEWVVISEDCEISMAQEDLSVIVESETTGDETTWIARFDLLIPKVNESEVKSMMISPNSMAGVNIQFLIYAKWPIPNRFERRELIRSFNVSIPVDTE